MSDTPYRNLGNLAAVEPYYQVSLRCDPCMVEWIGCWDQAACPECGNHDDWDRLMEQRGFYKRQRADFNKTHFGCVPP